MHGMGVRLNQSNGFIFPRGHYIIDAGLFAPSCFMGACILWVLSCNSVRWIIFRFVFVGNFVGCATYDLQCNHFEILFL